MQDAPGGMERQKLQNQDGLNNQCEMVHAHPDCSGTMSLSPWACHFEACMHFRRSEMFKYMVLSAPEAKNPAGYSGK